MQKAHVEPRKMQYLYAEGDDHVFMDSETFEQLMLPNEDLAEQIGYLLPNTEVQVNFHNNNPIGLELPPTVVLEVVETEGVVKGQTASALANRLNWRRGCVSPYQLLSMLEIKSESIRKPANIWSALNRLGTVYFLNPCTRVN